MPIIEILLFKGQSSEAKTRLINAVTDAFRMVIPAPPASITVMLRELERENYMRGGASRRRSEALPEPRGVVMAYLAALQATDFDAVRAVLTEDCTFRMPGGQVFDSPEDMAAWARPRTRSFDYSLLGMETAPGDTGPVVYMRGSMSGIWPDGTPFDDVSMVTRFVFMGARIRTIQVWHDLAEKRPHGVTPDDAPGTDSEDR